MVSPEFKLVLEPRAMDLLKVTSAKIHRQERHDVL